MIKTQAEVVVDAQVEAYNARDIEKFCSFYSENAFVQSFPDPKMTMNGISEIRTRYGQLFEKRPELNTKILNRIVQGNFVIDQEFICGVPTEFSSATAIYEIKENKIVNVWLIS